MGLTTALLSLALLLWQQSQSRSRSTTKQVSKQSRRAARTLADTDWQKRLKHLKDRWNPARLELEKIQISRR
jgi:Flp pilus assembly protein TadB